MRSAYTCLLRRLLPVIAECGIVILVRCPAHAQIEPGRYLYTADQSIVLQPAARVADDTIDLSWSPDSSRLVTFNSHVRPVEAGETETSSEFTVVRWVRGSHSASTLYSIRIEGNMTLIMPCVWLPTTNIAIQDAAWEESVASTVVNGISQKQTVLHDSYLWIDARSGTVKHIDASPRHLLSVSPSKPLAVLYFVPRFGPQDRPMLTTIRPDGSLGQSFEFAAHQAIGRLRWSGDGKRLTFNLSSLGERKKVTSSISGYYDPVTGEVGPLSPAPVQAPPAPKQAMLHVSQPARQLTEAETSAKVHPLWVSTTVKSEHPRLLACADANTGALSPDGSAIAYRSQGSAWVSELKAIPLAQFKQMLIQAQREAAVQHGKQVALAILMYAQDNNEIIPGPNQNVDLGQYLTDPTALSEFNQTYAGGPIADAASPATTILGTINGPGGVVDIYLDGHVKWRGQ